MENLLALGWKRFWFVLDGRLLTYYKSKSEYENLSACSGSVNVGIATNVSPIKASKGYPLQIVTRTQVYYLRASDKAELERWLISIQEVATIPPSIYLPYRTDPGIQFYRYSRTALSHWSLDTSPDELSCDHNLPLNFYRPSSLLKKCHSFAALNFSLSSTNTKSNNFWDDKNRSDFLSQSYNMYHSTLGYKSSTNSVDMKEMIPRHNNLNKLRHTSSMQILESSPQAGNLRRELARKLSSPEVVPEQIKNYEMPGMFSLPPLPIGKIYTNYEKTCGHDYDEIVDNHSSIYELCGVSAEKNSDGIYENVDEHAGRGDPCAITEDPWEKLQAVQGLSTTLSSAPRNRESLSNHECVGRNSLISISEIPEKEADFGNKKQNCLRAGTGTLSDNNDYTGKSQSQGTNNSAPDGTHKRKNASLSKRRSITGFFQKIFTKRRDAKSKEIFTSAPVDEHHDKRELRNFQSLPSNSLTSTQAESEKCTKQTRMLSQLRGLKPAVGSILSCSDDLLQELNQKIGERRRSASLNVVSALSESQRGTTGTNWKSSCEQVPSSNLQDFGAEGRNSVDPLTTVSTEADHTAGKPCSSEYLRKLAQFNRLSASLNPTLPVPLTPVKETASNKTSKVGRSQSCRVRLSDEPPMLPPKLKQIPKLSEYDVPQNNGPVPKQEPNPKCVIESTPMSVFRGLLKKHSAPDISFSSSPLMDPPVSGEYSSPTQSSHSICSSIRGANESRNYLPDSKSNERQDNSFFSTIPASRPPKAPKHAEQEKQAEETEISNTLLCKNTNRSKEQPNLETGTTTNEPASKIAIEANSDCSCISSTSQPQQTASPVKIAKHDAGGAKAMPNILERFELKAPCVQNVTIPTVICGKDEKPPRKSGVENCGDQGLAEDVTGEEGRSEVVSFLPIITAVKPAAEYCESVEVPTNLNLASSSQSPTVSASGDFDNLDVLSDVSSESRQYSPVSLSPVSSARTHVQRESDSSGDLVFKIPAGLPIQGAVLKGETIEHENPVNEHVPLAHFAVVRENDLEDDSHIYDDVPIEPDENLEIHYATFNSVSWESVEESEEISEMYDDFPVDPFTNISKSIPTTGELKSVEIQSELSACRSGMDQLRNFLEETDSLHSVQSSSGSFSNVRVQPGRGAVNRLGHSSVVEQLKQIVTAKNL